MYGKRIGITRVRLWSYSQSLERARKSQTKMRNLPKARRRRRKSPREKRRDQNDRRARRESRAEKRSRGTQRRVSRFPAMASHNFCVRVTRTLLSLERGGFLRRFFLVILTVFEGKSIQLSE